MENHTRRYGPSKTADDSGRQRQEIDMLRNEFEVMQRCDFAFIKEIGAASAEEYILKITSMDFLRTRHSEGEDKQ